MAECDLIAEARALCAAATPGPWRVDKLSRQHDTCPSCRSKVWAGNNEIALMRDADAAFMVGAQTLLPALADALESEQERAQVAEVRGREAGSVGVAEATLARLRAVGWAVAAHNDYWQADGFHTFWLFTHPSGRWVKGEGVSDAEALLIAEGMTQPVQKRTERQGRAAADRARGGP